MGWIRKTARSVERGRFVGPLLVVLVIASSCGETRPTVDEWIPLWRAATAALSELPDDGNPDACRPVLAVLRSDGEGLVPTPDPAIDQTVRDWLALAESAAFVCDPSQGGGGPHELRLAELAGFEAEVGAVLELDERTAPSDSATP